MEHKRIKKLKAQAPLQIPKLGFSKIFLKPDILFVTGQATLEFTLMFVIMVALIFGLLGMWKWSVTNIVKRQEAYNSSRLAAGSSSPGVSYGYSAPAISDSELNFLK
jgi:hypothetical protein